MNVGPGTITGLRGWSSTTGDDSNDLTHPTNGSSIIARAICLDADGTVYLDGPDCSNSPVYLAGGMWHAMQVTRIYATGLSGPTNIYWGW